MSVGDESEWLRVPRIEPHILIRQINAALVTHFDHRQNLRMIRLIDTPRGFPFHCPDETGGIFLFGGPLGRPSRGGERAENPAQGRAIAGGLERRFPVSKNEALSSQRNSAQGPEVHF